MALRAGVSVLVPLVVLAVLGHLEWSIFAAFGAITSLYGRTHVAISRLRMQLTLAVLLTLATAGGVVVGLSEHRAWLAVPLAAALAAGGSLLSDLQDWHPRGPLFLIFAFTACASLESRPPDVVAALVVAGLAAAFAVLVGAAGALVRRQRGAARPGPAGPAGSTRTAYAARWRWHVARSGIAVLLAGTAATASGIGHPYWAMVSAVVPLGAPDFLQQVVRGLHRVVGTAVGLGVTAVLFAIDPGGVVLIGVIVVLQVLAELLVGRNYALALVAITPLALLTVHLVAPVPAGVLLLDRGVETAIGVLVGVVVGWATRPGRRSRPSRPGPGPDGTKGAGPEPDALGASRWGGARGQVRGRGRAGRGSG